MATILPKRRHADSTAPTTGDLVEGEIAVNTNSQKIYVRDDANQIVELCPPETGDIVVDHTTVDITAGTGMTGGGDISATRTLNVIGGTGITANADDIEVDTTWADARYYTQTAADAEFLPETSDQAEVTGTTYSVVEADQGSDLWCSNASLCTITIPQTLAVGFQFSVSAVGTGLFKLTSLDNLNGAGADLTVNAQWDTVWVMQYSEGNWLVSGSVS